MPTKRPLDRILNDILRSGFTFDEEAQYQLLHIKLPTDKFHIRSFLGNAKNWRGHEARTLKAELREYLK